MLDQRSLNRALLARQLLLEREDFAPSAAVEHLLGLQAQASLPPYLGLWSRLEGFEPSQLGEALERRELVRLTLMRGTIHLVTARDATRLRPLVQTVIERGHNGAFGRRMGGADSARLAGATRSILAASQTPMAPRDIGRELVAQGIGDDLEAISNAARVYVPLVQVPPRGVWGQGGRVAYATLEQWTGGELDPAPRIEDVIGRYLGAFGPASVMDMQNWSGLTRLRAPFEGLRERLVTFEAEDGRELFDLPDAPRPGPDVAAPVRLLGEYDNVLLGHADRSRIIPMGFPWRAMLTPDPGDKRTQRFVNSVLVDGSLRAVWWTETDRTSATLSIKPFGRLAAGDREQVAAEAERVLALLEPEARRRIRFARAVR